MKPDLSSRSFCDDRGLSLVELIVVISIMVVLLGLVSVGVSMLFSRDAERSATLIDDALSETRLSAMSKKGTFIVRIHTEDEHSGDPSKNYIEIEKTSLPLAKPGEAVPAVTTDTTRIDIDKSVYITFGKKGALPTESTDDDLEVTFDKADGHVTQISNSAGNFSLDDVFEIKCTMRNKSKSKSVLLMPVTGRHYIK